MISLSSVFAIAAVALGLHYYSGSKGPSITSSVDDETERWSCRPFLPKLFVEAPPAVSHPAIKDALQQLTKFLSARFAEGDIDSLSVAVTTSTGPIFERNHGVIKGNESAASPPTNSHAMYRIASTAKIFAVLEGHILAQRGALSWSDPIEKYLPAFTYSMQGADPEAHNTSSKPPSITLYQLATHHSGLGRDWPPGVVSNWPFDLNGGGPPPTNGHPFPSNKDLLKTIPENILVSPPNAYPAYSNTGTGLLGLSLVAANRAASQHPESEPTTYADLLKRDVFEPLGMDDSHFLATRENSRQIVVPSLHPVIADWDFLDAMNPCAGQFSSLSDSIKFTETVLNAAHPKSLLTQSTLDRWLQPVHDFEEDDWTQLGMMWEIVKARDSNNRLRKIYWKLGAMAGYHSALAIHPGSSYGVTVLLASGKFFDAAKIAYDVFEIMQPAMDRALAEHASALYGGAWGNADGTSSASIVVDKGTLYAEKVVLNGSDVLSMFGAKGRMALRSSGRRDELRLDTGIPYYNGLKHMGCYAYWNGQDLWGHKNGVPVNVLYFTGADQDRVLHFPSADVVMRRIAT